MWASLSTFACVCLIIQSALAIRLSSAIFSSTSSPHWSQSVKNQTEPLCVAFKADVVDFIEGNKYSDSELESMFLSFIDSQLDFHLSVFRARSSELLEEPNITKSRFLETKAEVLHIFNSTMTELLPPSKVGIWKFEVWKFFYLVLCLVLDEYLQGHYHELASEIDVMIDRIDPSDELVIMTCN